MTAPRIGIWCLLLGVPITWLLLARRARKPGRLEDRFLLAAAPVLAIQLALLVDLKRYVYLLLILPFLALVLGRLASWSWERWSAGSWPRRGLLILITLLVLAEGAWGLKRQWSHGMQASSYEALTREIARPLPAGSKLLISQPYWLGLELAGDFEMRSINLAYVRLPDLTVSEVVENLAPDFVILERDFLERARPGHPSPHEIPKALAFFRGLDRHLAERCRPFQQLVDPSYGILETHDCQPRSRGGQELDAPI